MSLREVQVRATLDGRPPFYGSGTVVGPRLVLTAAHVVFGNDEQPLSVRVALVEDLPTGRDFAGQVVWPAAYHPDHGALDEDAALVEITDPQWDAGRFSAVLWGRFTVKSPGRKCEAVAFPKVMVDHGVQSAYPMNVRVNPHPERTLYDVDLSGAVPLPMEGSPWDGASGAGVFATGKQRNLLVGVVLTDERHHFKGDRFQALPIDQLFTDPDFRDHIHRAGGGPPGLAGIASVELADVLVPPMALGQRRQRRQPQPPGPAMLLRPDAEVVPFHGRSQLLRQLRTWCLEGGGVDMQLLVGAGGQGKTRLARELARQIADDTSIRRSGRWATGFVGRDVLDAEQRQALAATTVPLLLVIDQAETRKELLEEMMPTLLDADTSAPARVLLLARSAGDWWRQLTDPDPLSRWRDSVVVLPGLDLDVDRRDRFAQAVAAFARRLPELRPDTSWTQVASQVTAPADLADDRFSSPLTLQLAALTALLVTAEPSRGRPEELAEEALLRHERTYWESMAKGRHFYATYEGDPLRDAVATASLAGATTEAEAISLLKVRLAPNDRGSRIAPLMDKWLRDMYPPVQGHWGSLQPDRVAEYQAARRLEQSPTLLPDILSAASDSQVSRTMTSLGRILVNPALTDEQRTLIADQLTDVLTNDLHRYGPAVITTATRSPEPARLVQALDTATRRETTPGTLQALSQALPDVSRALGGYAAEVSARLVAQAREAPGQETVDGTRRLAAELATSSARLLQIGRPQDAVERGAEAVALARMLDHLRPDEFTALLAATVTNQAAAHLALEQAEEADESAREAVALYRRLGQTPPDHQAQLAHAVTISAAASFMLQRLAEASTLAEEAVGILRQLPPERPEESTADLARALCVQGMTAALGTEEYAQGLTLIDESVALYRRLDNPDAHSLPMASALTAQSQFLLALHRPDDARRAADEAVTLLQGLGTSAALASALMRHAEAHAALGDTAKAEPLISEAARILDTSFRERPTEVFARVLWLALHDHARLLIQLDQQELAATALGNEVAVLRWLDATSPSSYTANLAGALRNQSLQFARLGQSKEALSAIDAALSHYRELVAASPENVPPKLADASLIRGQLLAQLGRLDPAAEAIHYSVETYHSLAERWPDDYSDALDQARAVASRLRALAEAD